VWYKKNAEHRAKPKRNAVVNSMARRIVDTDIGEFDRAADRCCCRGFTILVPWLPPLQIAKQAQVNTY